MISLKASAAIVVLVATVLISAGAGYAVSRATMTAQVAVSCPTSTPVASAPDLPHALPNGPTIPVTKGKGW
jgi:hypothetical protein